MQKLSRFFQVFFKIILIFLVIFIWVRYFVDSLWQSVLITSAATIVVDFVTRIISRRHKIRDSLKKQEREDAENMFLSLSMDKTSLDFFLKLASSRHEAVKKKDFILITHPDGEKVILQPHLNHCSLSCDFVAQVAKKCKSLSVSKAVIVCCVADKEAYRFAKNFDEEIVILDTYESYCQLYKEYDIYPEMSMKYKKEKSLAFGDLLAYSLNRSRAKGYFFSAIVLLISTIFVRANIYYCIVSSLLIVLSLISLYSPFTRGKTKGSIL